MDFTSLTITDFYTYCLEGAKNKGYKWVVSLVARSEDVPDLYRSLIGSWRSLDSITGQDFLFLFAGKENSTFEEKFCSRITNCFVDYQAFYNKFVSILNPNANLVCRMHYDWRRDKKGYLERVAETQTDAINSLKSFFHLSEVDIPCLVFTSLWCNEQYVVPIYKTGNDLYAYFKGIINQIDLALERLKSMESKVVFLHQQQRDIERKLKKATLTLEEKIVVLHDELVSWAEDTGDADLIQAIDNRKYKVCSQPIRGKLSKYIDTSKEYERKNHITFEYKEIRTRAVHSYTQKETLKEQLEQINRELVTLESSIRYELGLIDGVIKRSVVMGKMNERNSINISVTGGTPQINVAQGSAKINAEQIVNGDSVNIEELLKKIRRALPQNASEKEIKTICDNLNVIEDGMNSPEENLETIHPAIKVLQGIKGSVEFMAAVSSLAAFIQTIL